MLKTLAQPQPNPLAELYAPIADELRQVEELLANELTSQYAFVNELLQKSNRLSGKRLRPALLLLTAKAFGNSTPEHIKLAAAVEMVHTATLIHDDILDSADQRRHSPTINYEFGNQVAILTGDFLFSHAFYLTSTLETTFAAREIGSATNKVCEGEIRQIGTKEQFDITESEYIEIIDAKTAVLCSCAAKLGAHYAGIHSKGVEAAAQYGTQLGIAFQIVDDLLDILGDESDAGKSLGTDLEQKKPTLPIIHFLQSLPAAEKTQFLQQLLNGELAAELVRERLVASGSIQYAQNAAHRFAELAAESISLAPDSPTKSILLGLPTFVLNRSR